MFVCSSRNLYLPSFPTRRSSDLLAAPLPVVVAEALASVPPGPLATTAVTVTPFWLTGLPLASCSCTTGCWANGAPLCALLDGSVIMASFAAAPVVPVAVNVTGLPVSPAAVAVSVFVPAVVPSVHDVTAAMPLPFVAPLVGLTVPPPDVTVNVTVTSATGLPAPSRTITDGGVATARPDDATSAPQSLSTIVCRA